MKGATLKDVARAADVSIASASRAINGLDNVAEEVRRRVLDRDPRLRRALDVELEYMGVRRFHVRPSFHGHVFGKGHGRGPRPRAGSRRSSVVVVAVAAV